MKPVELNAIVKELRYRRIFTVILNNCNVYP